MSEDNYRDILRELRGALVSRTAHLAEAIHEQAAPSGNPSAAPVHLADQSPGGIDADAEILDRVSATLAQIDDALARLDEGTYGKCARCGGEIGAQRLEVVPFTPFCRRCAELGNEADRGNDADRGNMTPRG